MGKYLVGQLLDHRVLFFKVKTLNKSISGFLGSKKILSELEKFLQLSLEGLFVLSGFLLPLKLVVTCMFNATLAARNLLEVISFWGERTSYAEPHLLGCIETAVPSPV